MSPLALLLVGAAAATTPGGWRVQAALPQPSVALRPVMVLGDPVAPIAQATVDLRVPLGPVALDAELPWVHTWGRNGRWSRSYPGQLRMGASAWCAREHIQLGLELAVPLTRNEQAGSSWASLAKEVMPSLEVGPAMHTLWTRGGFSFTGRLFLGGRWGEGARWFPPTRTPYQVTRGIFAPEIAAAVSAHLAGPLGLVTETEWLQDPAIPFSTRALARLELPLRRGGLDLDLGVQVTLIAMLGDEAVQPIAQLRWWPATEAPPPDSPGQSW